MAGSKPGDDGLADGGLEDSDEFLGRDSGLSQDAAERTDGNDAVCRHNTADRAFERRPFHDDVTSTLTYSDKAKPLQRPNGLLSGDPAEFRH